MLFFYPQTIDKSGQAGQFEDLSSVEKYEMDEADYAQRTGTLWHQWLACWKRDGRGNFFSIKVIRKEPHEKKI